MSKEKYQIQRKSDFICLTILLHDLKCFDEELSEPTKDIDAIINKMRNARNVFVSLHNLKDSMNRIRIHGGEAQFISETRRLRRDLDFIVHIRNKGVGHLDRTLLERAAQWVPELFHVNSYENDNYLTFMAYKAVLESAINSYLNEKGKQKVFETEIDFFYPPNAEQFFIFLSDIVKRSIAWLETMRDAVGEEINLHSDDMVKEMSAVAGGTNFNLEEESYFEFSEEEMKNRIVSVIERIREMGIEESSIKLLENRLLQ